jgi:hypothetical protein
LVKSKVRPCFSCGEPVPLSEGCQYTYWCDRCDVREVILEQFVSEVRTVASQEGRFGKVIFLDHSDGYYPSP